MAIKTINDTHLTSIANAIRSKNGETSGYTPADMPAAIGRIPTGGSAEIPSEAFSISGNCQYMFSNKHWDWFIENYGSQVTTSSISNTNNMFVFSGVETIPFTINLSTSGCSCVGMFENCTNLKTLPEVSGKSNSFSKVFSYCYRIRQIPDSWGNLDFSYFYTQSYTSMNAIFDHCYSLREIPPSLLSNLHNDKTTSIYSKTYYMFFNYCYSLNEILNLPVDGATITSNMFGATFERCSRLKNMTFATNNGTPYTANWKTQTIDLTKAVGYSYADGTQDYILNYNSGITKDKEVIDDATYQALKNDLDWWTIKKNYCRYNHDSAVATINSLPDTSAYLTTAGGTNTIKFDGNSGSATDGGAINTLTEEEIAVATAKGWTVTLV